MGERVEEEEREEEEERQLVIYLIRCQKLMQDNMSVVQDSLPLYPDPYCP